MDQLLMLFPSHIASSNFHVMFCSPFVRANPG
jgi:hypothetical protein